jgi:ABC-type polysaccharide/polyol phosphate export permease
LSFWFFQSGLENKAKNQFNQLYRPNAPGFFARLVTWFAHLCALNTKNAIQTLRKPEVVIAQFVIPLIVVMFFCVCIGSPPRSIPIGIINQEQCNPSNLSVLPNATSWTRSALTSVTTNLPIDLNDTESDDHSPDPSDLCLSEDLLKSLNTYALKQIRFDDRQKALEEVRAGRLLGILHVKPQFSEALIDKLNFNNESGLVGNSIVTFEGDVSNQLLLNMFSLLFYEGYLKFVKYALVKLNMNPILGRLPVSVGGFLFGRYEESDYSGINAYAGPGLLMIIVYSVAFALTGLALLVDKSNGMFERNRVAGVQSSPMLLSLVIVNMSLFALGLFVLLLVAVHLFDIPLNGSMTAAYVLLLLQSLAGLANGLLLSSVLNSISEYAILGNGILLFMFILSGALWSVESMPFYVRWLAHLLPATQPIESLRSILVRGLHFTEAPVYHGYLVSIAWSTAMLTASKYLFDAHV